MKTIERTKITTNEDTKERIKVLSKMTGIREKDIAIMQAKDLINIYDETIEDLLRFLSRFWHSNFWVRRMLTYRGVNTRKKLINTSGLNRAELHAHTRIAEAENARDIWRPLLRELIQNYKLDTQVAKKIIKRMATKVRMQRYHQRKKLVITSV